LVLVFNLFVLVNKMRIPKRYFTGLTRKQKQNRQREIAKFGRLHWKDPKAYVGFRTDRLKTIKRKTSGYTVQWRKLFPHAKNNSLKAKSKVTGVPLRFITECYNRGMGAWRTGHRPGATEQQWGYARVHSMLLCGKTHYSTDADIVRRARATSKRAKKWFSRCPVISANTKNP
jgi:hypothetical protein